MQRYVIVENIRRFESLLQQETSAEKQRLLARLLQEEELKLAALDAAAPQEVKPAES